MKTIFVTFLTAFLLLNISVSSAESLTASSGCETGTITASGGGGEFSFDPPTRCLIRVRVTCQLYYVGGSSSSFGGDPRLWVVRCGTEASSYQDISMDQSDRSSKTLEFEEVIYCNPSGGDNYYNAIVIGGYMTEAYQGRYVMNYEVIRTLP